MNKILLLLLVVPFIGYGQCKKKEKVKTDDGTYYGCLNDVGKFHGNGIFTWKNGNKYDGEWKNGVINGKGELITNYINNQGFEVKSTYNGGFVDGTKRGEGGEKITKFTKGKDRQIWTEKGEFKFNILFNGIKKIEYNSGQIITSTIKEGELLKEKSNRKNYYNEEDIIGNTSESIVDLQRRENDHYYITMTFNDVDGSDCIFDPGAFTLRVGKRLYDRIQDEGVEIRDLNHKLITSGVGGESQSKYVIFDEIGIGDYIIKNVVAIIGLENDYTLVGVQFFDKFSNVQWDMKEKTLKLYR